MLDLIAARFSLVTYGSDSPEYVHGRRFIEAYQDARVAFVPAPPIEVPNYWSNRIYLAAGTGIPCVVGWAPGLEAHYAGGSEVVYFHDSAEMLREIDLLLKSPGARARIGAAGRARTLRDHTYEARARELIASIGGPTI
ncbi:MAG: glycosyltransferase family 1 protein [Acidobacteria bacterium]|nr:glycosyltransferase family 1 protein [Acidobacteriota bacterium]